MIFDRLQLFAARNREVGQVYREQPQQRAPAANVYFSQQEVGATTETASRRSSPPGPSLTQLLDTQLMNQFLLTSATTSTTTTTTSPTATTTTTKTTTTQRVPVVEKIALSTPRPRPEEVQLAVVNPRKLSPAELLQLCFDSQQGCDFSANEVGRVSSTSTTTTTTTTPAPSRETEERISSEEENRLKERLRLCFFSGICDDSETEETEEKNDEKKDERVTAAAGISTAAPAVTDSARTAEIRRRVRERAQACFLHGQC